LSQRFDIVECAGVLRHMANPAAGLRVLKGLLTPGGWLYLGLYSTLARHGVAKIR
jgi:2-polyprenyl-3-methyl-5-hydroxy-6-metoxy-1,4-benzoquinol methylase